MFLHLEKQKNEPLYAQIYKQIKENILSGSLKSHEKLPGKRQLKTDLAVSMTTIETAYRLLMDEDLIYSREKSGCYVSELDTLRTEHKTSPEINKPEPVVYQLPLASVDTSIVQNDVIKQISKNVFNNHTLLNQGAPSGETELKDAVMDYLHINRGAACSRDQIFIGPSTEYLLNQVLYLLKRPSITIEDPGYPMLKGVLNRLNMPFDIAEVETDGINIKDVQALNNTVTHVTPSHQFPGGSVLSLNKRIQLLNHAAACGSYIIEDDYDSEFRYTGKPLPSLQGLDQNDRTIYMNTFSKSIYPSLRLAVMVLPKETAEEYYRHGLSCNVSRHIQHITADFINGGYLERHINRVRKIYGEKMERITDYIESNYPGAAVQGAHTGMHFILKVPGIDVSKYAEKHRLLCMNHYAVQDKFKDSIIVGIGEQSAGEIMKILNMFLKDAIQ
ncbi:MocR-like pyridoxine biosynthesis transcription factor PdxR [Corticicoccus populi]|uniref:PLP-dependent aminotransferase family protein n=1 Tax=Corticicoccus populi TaxID=1812821 RepID=A0ABW5WWN8_9STAP